MSFGHGRVWKSGRPHKAVGAAKVFANIESLATRENAGPERQRPAPFVSPPIRIERKSALP
jgi:hypothetical protein